MSFLTSVKDFLINNNTQIFLTSILLFIATVSYTRYNVKETAKKERYEEMKYRLDSVMYENYRKENQLLYDVTKRDSAWVAENKEQQ
jgi:hypothetical protein